MSTLPTFTAACGLAPKGSSAPQAQASRAWSVHAPFVAMLLEHTRPALVVDLGAEGGVPAATFRQSTARGAACHTVDTRLAGHREAAAAFADGSIDLLHVDAGDPARLATLDLAPWRAKLGPQALVLVHGTRAGRKLRRLWALLRQRHPSFEFEQGLGLGVLCLGPRVPPLDGVLARRIEGLVQELERLRSHAAEVTAKRERAEEMLETRHFESLEKDVEIAERDARILALKAHAAAQAARIDGFEASLGLQLVLFYGRLRLRVFPAGTRHGDFYERRRGQLLRWAQRWVAHRSTGRARPSLDTIAALPSRDPARHRPWLAPLTPLSRQSLGARILIVAELSIPACKRYRVDQKVDMFEHLGVETTVLSWRDAEACRAALPFHGLLIFYRVPAAPHMVLLATEARRLGVPSFFDVDDLIFDWDAYRRQLLASGAPSDRMASSKETTAQYRQMLSHCQHGIGSTAAIARSMGEIVPGKTHVVPNALDEGILALAAELERRPVKTDPRFVTIGYGSGSRTHDGDFGVVASALLAVMQRHPQVRLAIHGPLELPAPFRRFADRVFQIPFLQGDDYLRALASWQISIAPLEDSLFNEAKSNIKFIEAAILGVPSICSGTGPFREGIEHGRTGMIADTPEEWEAALTRLVLDAGLRHGIAEEARRSVLSRYHPQVVAARQLQQVIGPLLPAPATRLKVLAVNVLFAPVSFGGATVVAEQLCRRLQADGCDVTVFTAILGSELEPYSVMRYEVDGLPVIAVQVADDTQRALDYDDPQVGEIFARLLKSLRPDVVHFHSVQRLGATMAHACVEAGVPYAITLHDAWWLCERQFMVQDNGVYCNQKAIDLRACSKCVPDSGFTFKRRFFLGDVLDRASLLLAPSEFQRELYVANGVAPQQIAVNRNGVPLPARPRPARRPGSPLRMAYLGGRAVHKGYFWLQQVLEGMRAGGYELVITDIALRTGAASVAATEWRVSGQVRVVAPFEQAEMDAFYDDIDVLLVPSLWKESFGLVVREALARGIWVIATAAGGVVEDIVDGVNGRVIEIGDTDAFRGAIEDALASPDRLPAGGVNAMLPRIRGYDEQAAELKAYLQRIAAAPAAARVVGTTRRAWRSSVIPIAAHGSGPGA
ncbi:glycosyltransferase [Variovorax sp.]|jgi:O-antigen biosynthesis protein|uniref:glycosyltransferase n=1 Tax=Variovorax sp. TaxID=1871043 RepID=UPI0011F73A6D|nr:glycosyltransferase [Variovorax sp.]TAJ67027.1 MAG: glycosyltransferase [Variovorax sp.]